MIGIPTPVPNEGRSTPVWPPLLSSSAAAPATPTFYGTPAPTPNQSKSTPVWPPLLPSSAALPAAPTFYSTPAPAPNHGFFSPMSRPPPQGACVGVCPTCGTNVRFPSANPDPDPLGCLPLDDDDVTMLSVDREIDLTTADLHTIRKHFGMTTKEFARNSPDLIKFIILRRLVVDGFERNSLWFLRFPGKRIRTSGSPSEKFQMICLALQLE
jgi:hypothetical protein